MALTEGEKSIEGAGKDDLLEIVKQQNEKIAQLTKLVEEKQTSSSSAEDIAKIVSAAVNAHNENKKLIDYSKGIQVEEIDKDDYDKEGVMFSVPRNGYFIVDDVRMGHVVRLPYNKDHIFFSHQGTKVIQGEKGKQTLSFATYVSHSKKEIQWLRDHTKYNIYFYEAQKKVMSENGEKMIRIASTMKVVSQYSPPELLKRCDELGVEKSNDMDAMRAAVTYAMVERDLASEKKILEERLGDIHKDMLLAEKRK